MTLPVALSWIRKMSNPVPIVPHPQWHRPYKLSRWDSFKLMVYDANPYYYLVCLPSRKLSWN